MKHKISGVINDSIAEKLNISAGDYLISINDNQIMDVLDYHYLANEEKLTITIEKVSGKIRSYEINKDYSEDIGIIFENAFMDDYKSCHNKCIFCFIDQMPPGMRETLYFKDDDARLSFLQGNYITLTNMKDEDINRVIKYHMSPVNISVHTTNPKLREMMLHNKNAGRVLEYLDRLYDADIEMNGQIVLCKDVNDKKNLDETISKLLTYAPVMKSLSVVPSGLTKYRDKLYPLKLFEKQDAIEVLNQIEYWQKKAKEKLGINFAYASDEWFFLADNKFPPEEEYDGYPQIENGVGMVRSLINEFEDAMYLSKKKIRFFKRKRTVTIACGTLVEPVIRNLADKYMIKHPYLTINVKAIINKFFGENITVSGLITGGDLINALKEEIVGDALFIPISMLRSNEEVFLDDITVSEVENTLQVPVVIVKSNGYDFVSRLNEY